MKHINNQDLKNTYNYLAYKITEMSSCNFAQNTE